ncbi:hypothetical protein GWI33_022476 [Rhynchophorus ferrugineus]|uniref:Uncharacterized protein n=1 Tax=Rhynchophorus ferrugineus TaxID=354439 RepID=A0A834HRY7_RHYFE|nr:hypothetical protein GWI33_022476 [Rhynchophorus ferrugineus]
METRSILIILLGAGFFADTALSLPPSYSEQYAKVRYQPHDDLRKAELNLEKRDREEGRIDPFFVHVEIHIIRVSWFPRRRVFVETTVLL